MFGTRKHENFADDSLFDDDLLEQMCYGLDEDYSEKHEEMFGCSSEKNKLYPDEQGKSLNISQSSLLSDFCVTSLFDCDQIALQDEVAACFEWEKVPHYSDLLSEMWQEVNSDSKDKRESNGMEVNEKPEEEEQRFPQLLRMILNDERHSSVISWCNDGKSFAIHNQSVFENEIIPSYFLTKRWRSFQKQLNIYGFKKYLGKRRVYYHPYFVEDKPSVMASMKREKVWPRYKKTDASDN